MRLPPIELDDRRFQDLVSEARLRIHRACPEWTEHNVSDPGITLIELFAWMTEMTIYRLNRVPDKLHVALMELLGIRLDGPTGAPTDAALPAQPRRPTEPIEIPGGDDRGRHAAHRDRGVDRLPGRRGLHDPAGAARGLRRRSAAASSRTSASADGTARPQGADQLPFGAPAAGRRRALPRLRGADIAKLLLAGRRWRPRRRAARASTPRTRRCAGRSRAGRRQAGTTPRCSRTSPAASTTAPARSSCSCPPRSAVEPLGRPARCTGCAAGSTTRRAPARRDDLHAPARDLLDHRRADRRAARRRRTPPRVESEVLGAERRHAGPGRSGCATRRCSSRRRARRSRSRTRSPGDWERWELRENFVELDRVRPPLHARPRRGRGRARPGDPRDRRRLDAVRRGARRRARCCASPATATAAAARGNVAAGTLNVLRSAIPGVDTVTNPRAGDRRRRRRVARAARASARRWRSARATARSPPRTSSSSPARRRRASRARSACPPQRRRAGPRCTSSRTSTRPTASCAYDELVPDDELLDRGRGVPRRAPADRHDASQLLPCRFRGLSRRRATSRPRRSPTWRASRRTSRTRSTRTSTRSSAATPDGLGDGLGVRARAQPGRAVRRRPRRRRRRVREDPAHLRDRPGDRRAGAQARRHATSCSSPTS